MTYPLTNELGVRWLGHSRVALRLHKPAYNGDRLSVPLTQTGEQTYLVECYNAAGVLLAQLTVELLAELPPVDPRAQIEGAATKAKRVEIDWSVIEVNTPRSRRWPGHQASKRTANTPTKLADDLAGVPHRRRESAI
jgi:hypothetical protein